MSNKIFKKDDVNISICGEAGQGIETVTDILIKSFKSHQLNVFSTKEYMSRIRGGHNTSDIRISSKEIAAPLDRIDFLIALNKGAVSHVQKRITDETFVIYDDVIKDIDGEFKGVSVPLTKISVEVGGKIFSNVISAGIIMGLLGLSISHTEDYLENLFKSKTADIIEKNKVALQKGYEIGQELAKTQNISVDIDKDSSVEDKILINGNDSTAIGCIAGGCDFIASYPMTPGTGVFTYMAGKSDDYNIIVDQAEDEISAINMGIGAWYAGSRAMVSTSGGGFALMTEGVSLAGMIESPMVIHIAQRPGPATGLPTRTEQGDLELALYSGHGEFPRVIFAPGNLKDAFELSQKAFNITDKYQVPVFILTDQYLVDSYSLTLPFDIDNAKIEEFITKTSSNYKRYELTDSGLSPRGVPNYGEGLVCVDSDEHDESGHITEDLDLRVKMVDKRLKKLDLLQEDIVEPELIGDENYKTLVVAWGSTYAAVKEAVENLDMKETAFLYIKQVYPLHEKVREYMEKAEKTIIVENNATAQLAKLIRSQFGFDFNYKILKYNGLAFRVDELTEMLKAQTKQLIGRGANE